MSPTVREDCPCPNTTCSRHMLCEACEASQEEKDGIPFCRRPKRSLLCRIRKWFGFDQ